MEQKTITKEESLSDVIDVVKKLIAQLEEKINSAIKKLPGLNNQAGQF